MSQKVKEFTLFLLQGGQHLRPSICPKAELLLFPPSAVMMDLISQGLTQLVECAFVNGLLNPLVCLCDSYPSAHPHHSDDSCSSHHCMPIWWHIPEPEDIHLHDNPIKSVLLAPFFRKRIGLCLKSYGKEIVKQFQSNFFFPENPGSGVETQRMYFACIYSLVCKVIGLFKKKKRQKQQQRNFGCKTSLI